MKKKKFLFLIFTILLVYFILGLLVQKNGFYLSNTPYTDLSTILVKDNFSSKDYLLLQNQTGLYPEMIDILKQENNFAEKIQDFQKDYLSRVKVSCEKMNFITHLDAILTSGGNSSNVFDIAPYKKGYIFLTKSTHTFNWRHGHAAIVIDEKRGKTLEALEPGTVSMEQNVSKWALYSTFKMMRLKNTPQSTLDEIAAYASNNLKDLPYNIFALKNDNLPIKSTECSLLVWQAFKPFGYDIDYNGKFLVLPQDIAKSSLLETLQIYGFNPERDW